VVHSKLVWPNLELSDNFLILAQFALSKQKSDILLKAEPKVSGTGYIPFGSPAEIYIHFCAHMI
jgi:hypothetical protein